MFVGTFSCPDYTGRCTGRIESGMWLVSFVGFSELLVYAGILLCEDVLAKLTDIVCAAIRPERWSRGAEPTPGVSRGRIKVWYIDVY